MNNIYLLFIYLFIVDKERENRKKEDSFYNKPDFS